MSREINPTEYAAGHGYALDAKASSRNSKVMRDAQGDKIASAREAHKDLSTQSDGGTPWTTTHSS
ncbi:MAG: hypothetical protein WBG92_04170 [Thiohalocapsa sp.]